MNSKDYLTAFAVAKEKALSKMNDEKVLAYTRLNKIAKNTKNSELPLAATDFCSMCLIEYHIRHSENMAEAYDRLTIKETSMLPLIVPLLIQALPEFKLGVQGDAQEFLLFLLENLIQATFHYRGNPTFQQQMESFIPRVFQGLLEKRFTCKFCKHVKKNQEPFLDLSLVSLVTLSLM